MVSTTASDLAALAAALQPADTNKTSKTSTIVNRKALPSLPLDYRVEQLDYAYISHSTNPEELVGLLSVLDSGREGKFPDLEDFCANRLRQLGVTVLEGGRADVKTPEQEDLVNWMRTQKDETQAVSLARKNSQKERNRAQRSVSTCAIRNIEPPRLTVGGKVLPPLKTSRKEKSKHRNSQPLSAEYANKAATTSYLPLTNDGEGEFNVTHLSKCQSRAPKLEPPRCSAVGDPDLKPVNGSEPGLELAISDRRKGNEAYKSKDYDEAVAYYERSIKACPTRESWANLSAAQVALSNYEEAESAANEGTKLDPDWWKSYSRRSVARAKLGMYREARYDLVKAMERIALDTTIKSEERWQLNERMKKLLKECKEKQSGEDSDDSAMDGKLSDRSATVGFEDSDIRPAKFKNKGKRPLSQETLVEPEPNGMVSLKEMFKIVSDFADKHKPGRDPSERPPPEGFPLIQEIDSQNNDAAECSSSVRYS